MAGSTALPVLLQASIVKLEANGHWLAHSTLPSFDALQLIIEYGPPIQKHRMPAIFWPSNSAVKVQFFFPETAVTAFSTLSASLADAA